MVMDCASSRRRWRRNRQRERRRRARRGAVGHARGEDEDELVLDILDEGLCGLGWAAAGLRCWAALVDCTVGCTARWAPFLFSLLFSVYNSVFYFLFEFHIWILLLLQVSQLLILSGSNILIIRLLIYLNKHFIWASIAYLWSLFKMLNRHELILSF
jgi:hypothetical protein